MRLLSARPRDRQDNIGDPTSLHPFIRQPGLDQFRGRNTEIHGAKETSKFGDCKEICLASEQRSFARVYSKPPPFPGHPFDNVFASSLKRSRNRTYHTKEHMELCARIDRNEAAHRLPSPSVWEFTGLRTGISNNSQKYGTNPPELGRPKLAEIAEPVCNPPTKVFFCVLGHTTAPPKNYLQVTKSLLVATCYIITL